MNEAGVPPRIVMELMRHSDMRLTHKTYTDATCFSLFNELEKVRAPSSSLLASLNPAFSCPNAGNPVQPSPTEKEAEIVATGDGRAHLAKVVPMEPTGVLAERARI